MLSFKVLSNSNHPVILCLRPAGEENDSVLPNASEHQDQGCRIRETEVMGMEFTTSMFKFVRLETKPNSFFYNLEKISALLVNHRKDMSRTWALQHWR